MGPDAEAENASDVDWTMRESSSDEEDDDDDDEDELDEDTRANDFGSRKKSGVRSSDLDALSRFLPPPPKREVDASNADRTDGKSFLCSFEGCSKMFGKPSRLETHMRTHTGERPFLCDVPGCGKSYARNQHLRRHLLAHEKEKASAPRESRRKFLLADESKLKQGPPPSSPSTSFVCAFEGCGKQLASERSLKAHANIHGGVRFACESDGCAQAYPTLKSLKRHEREVHGPPSATVLRPDTPSEDSEWESGHNGGADTLNDADAANTGDGFKTYSCASCDKSFKKHWQLKSHGYDHTGVLPFRCKEAECDRAFLYRSHLRRHVKQRHRLHRCQLHPDCQLIFNSSLEARRHFKERHATAKGKKTCTACGKIVNASYFKAHLETHREVRTVFACPRSDCRRQFLAKKNLVAHLKINHGVDGGEDAEDVDGFDKDGSPPRLACTVAGCAVEFVSKVTRDRHVRSQHGPDAERAKAEKKKRRKCKPRKDLAKDLAGLLDHSDATESRDGQDDGTIDAGDDYVLSSLRLPTRHDDLLPHVTGETK